MIPRSIPRLVLLVLGLSLLMGCGSNDNGTNPPPGGGPLARNEFRLEFTGLGDPSPGHYEVWFIIDGVPRSGGKFRVSSSDSLLDLAGKVVPEGVLRAPAGLDVTLASQGFVSLEPDDDSDPLPSNTRILGGDFSGSSADLAVTHAQALAIPLDGAGGQFLLDTPTTQSDLDFNRGIAWITPGPDTLTPPTSSLVLVDLPDSGWTYEGWVMRPSASGFLAYSTGRFTSAEGFDSDRAGATAGAFGDDANGDGRGDGFAFPAQDFVAPSGNVPPLILDSGGFHAVVSIEPKPDNSITPFFVRVLDAEIPAATSAVAATITGLGEIGQGHFEAWSFASGAATSIGKFIVDDAGIVRDLSNNPITEFQAAGDLFLSQRLFVTVEEEGDADDTPSRSKLLEGIFSDSLLLADLSADSVLENGASLRDPRFSASYVLNTFTTQDASDFGLGIWFFTPGSSPSDPDVASLVLPFLKEGWKYEGWVIDHSTGTAYTTGKFISNNDADEDLAGATAGTFGTDINGDGLGDGIRYPGQEFISAAGGVPAPLDLDGGDFGVLVTIEPSPDNDPGPFLLHLFADDLIDSLGALVTQPAPNDTALYAATLRVSRGPVLRAMTNVAGDLPVGRITVSGD